MGLVPNEKGRVKFVFQAFDGQRNGGLADGELFSDLRKIFGFNQGAIIFNVFNVHLKSLLAHKLAGSYKIKSYYIVDLTIKQTRFYTSFV